MERVKGLPNPQENQRATDMFLKVRWLLDKHHGRGVVFSTGTPISNTIAELWTVLRYLLLGRLEELGLQHFDAWAKTFAETVVTLEQTVSGTYRPTARFAKFGNVPELAALFQEVADVRMAAELPAQELRKPRLVGGAEPGKRIYVVSPPSAGQTAYMASIARRVDELRGKDPHQDNMLKIASDARKAALDLRLVWPDQEDHPASKVNLAVENILDVYQQTRTDRGTQLVFLDLGTPKAKEPKAAELSETDAGAVLDGTETAEEVQQVGSVYEDLRRKLVAGGIPSAEVRFIHEAKTREQRAQLFAAVRAGTVRVLVGSTEKLGAGTNVQTRLAALHHLDAPWRPRDVEQREGRILRQGNLVYGPVLDADGQVLDPGRGVRIYQYVTEHSFDGFIWVRYVSPKSHRVAQAA